MDLQLSGQVAVITGASRGIGAAVARELAREGVSVVVNYASNRDSAEKVCAGIRAEGGRATAVGADVGDPASARGLIQSAIDQFGRLDILINNAGVVTRGPFISLSVEDFDRVIDTNLKGTWNCSQAAAVHMIEKRYGRILNASSIAASIPAAGHAVYAASKAAIRTLTEVIAGELAPYNVLVNAYMPGTYETDGTASVMATRGEELLSTIGLRRLGQPEEIARVITFLVSPVNSYMTGSTVLVHGGKLTLQNPMKPWRDAGLMS